ncbi:hypothetical protein N0V90_011987 [Kalmusia sp. IMI 367209]|nr:hypothetical protein N0V90_011987 [Kalmusia sp. IMI 367209]
MLLQLRRINRLRHPLHPSHARSLTTLPRATATYIKRWDPTRHSPQLKILSAPQDAPRKDLRKVERAQLQHSQGHEVFLKKTRNEDGSSCIALLNKLLQLGDTQSPKPGLHLRLWKVYSQAKAQCSELVHAIPDQAWDILWRTQDAGALSVERKALRLRELGKDMFSRERYEAVGQRVQYLDGLFLSGHEEQALKEWEEDHEGANNLPRHDYKPEHLQLGARMYALSGNPDRAREVMEELFELYPSWNLSIMKVVFRAHTETISTWHHDLAKGMYLKMKERMGKELTLNDYDSFFVGFLEARHLAHSKMVFRDMIKGKYLGCSSHPKDIEEVLKRLHMLSRLGTNIAKMTSIGLQAITTLPPPYHSHVYRHWMKAAVVKDAPEAAAQILDMMFSRGCQPETVHFNLLLKALMRTKLNHHVSKAEDIAWRMIEEVRKSGAVKSPNGSASDFISKWVHERQHMVPDNEVLRDVPKANVITFALMMQHHADRLQWEHVDYLARQLKENGIQPNAALMNVLMDKACRQGKFSEAWKIYKALTDVPVGARGVFPDGASIRCLWKTLRLALGDHATRNDPALPRPRELLAETVQWWKLCRCRHDAESFRVGLAANDHGALSSLMMHCFSYSQDLAGSLVSLHILRKMFDILPSDKALATLQKHAAWVDMHREAPNARYHFYHSGVNKNTIEKLGRVYYILMERRFQRMGITGDDYAQLNEEEIADIGLNLLSEFVRVIMKRSHAPEVVEIMITEAKREVGVLDMSTGDLDAFNVA